MSNDGLTIFKTNPSSGTDASEFLKEAFTDFSSAPTNNTGLTSSASTNPLGYFFADDESTKFGTKTLFVKSIKLLEERQKWISSQPTYEIEFNETFPGVKGYAFGNIDISYLKTEVGVDVTPTPFILVRSNGGVGVICNGARRTGFMCLGQGLDAVNDQFAIDGSNTISSSYSALMTQSVGLENNKYLVNVSNTSDSTNNIHDFRLTQDSSHTDVVRVFGFVINFGDTNIQQLPGTSYINKAKVTTTSGVTMSTPTFGSSMGGNALIYKTAAGYTLNSMSATCIQSVAQGTSGTNLLAVSSGFGGSFLIGQHIYLSQGTSNYFGLVQSISTDTLTVFPTLTFGISNSIYTGTYVGPTLAINASMFTLAETIDFSKYGGTSAPTYSTYQLVDNFGKWGIWGNGFAVTSMIGISAIDAQMFGGATQTTGFVIPYWSFLSDQYQANGLHAYATNAILNIEGRFAAAEIEFVNPKMLGTTSYISASLIVNSLPGFNIVGNTLGVLKHTVFTDGNNGWNHIRIGAGVSTNQGWFIGKINLYDRNFNQGISFGRLSHIPVNQAYHQQPAHNATTINMGTYQRIFANKIALSGQGAAWVRSDVAGAPGILAWVGTTTTASFTQQYYGSRFAIIGLTGSASATLLVDGAQYGATLNVMHSVALGWHTVVYQSAGSFTTIIGAFDYVRPYGEMKSLIKYGAKPVAGKKKIKIPIVTPWKRFDMKIKGVTTNPTKSPAANRDAALWRRVGNVMEITYNYMHRLDTNGTAGSGTYLFMLPQGFSVDREQLPNTGDETTVYQSVGAGILSNHSGGTTADTLPTRISYLNYFGFDCLIVWGWTDSTDNLQSTIVPMSSTSFPLNTASINVSFNASVPIKGWETHEEIEVVGG